MLQATRPARRFFILLILSFTLTAQLQLDAAEPLEKHWPVNQQIPLSQIDHSALDRLLRKYVDVRGLVNYKAWKATLKDRQALQNYLKHLSQADPNQPTTQSVKLAFWINAYMQ